MKKNSAIRANILGLRNNIQNNKKMISVDIKLASNQKDDAQRVKDNANERVGGSYKKIAL